MSGYERDRDERDKRIDERAAERKERSGPEQSRGAPERKVGDAYGCVDWFDYDPEAEARQRRVAH